MSKELIPTEGLWYKIKRFIKNIFFKEEQQSINKEEKTNENTLLNNNLKEKFKKENQKQVLANKLRYGEIGPTDLNESETDEMIEYFKKDIQNIDNELSRIKQHILLMRKKLNQ